MNTKIRVWAFIVALTAAVSQGSVLADPPPDDGQSADYTIAVVKPSSNSTVESDVLDVEGYVTRAAGTSNVGKFEVVVRSYDSNGAEVGNPTTQLITLTADAQTARRYNFQTDVYGSGKKSLTFKLYNSPLFGQPSVIETATISNVTVVVP